MMDGDTITKLVDQCEVQRGLANTLERELAAERAAREQAQTECKEWQSSCGALTVLRQEAEARLANSIDQNELLAAISRRGFEVSGLDGDESPEDIIASWIAATVEQARESDERPEQLLKAEKELDALKLKLEAAKEALSFYAGCPALTSHDAASYDSGSFENDKGQRAREALSQLNTP